MCIEVHACAVLEGLGRAQQRKTDIHQSSRGKQSRVHRHHAAGQNVSGNSRTGEIQCSALSGHSFVAGRSVHLHPAHPRPQFLRKNFHLSLFANAARNHRARDHGAKSLHGEGAVNGQAKIRILVFGRNFGCQACQRLLQLFQPRTFTRADRNDGRGSRVEKRAAQKVFEFRPHHLQGVGIH